MALKVCYAYFQGSLIPQYSRHRHHGAGMCRPLIGYHSEQTDKQGVLVCQRLIESTQLV